MEQTRTRYSTAAQVLHWATAILVLVACIYGPGGSETRVYSAARDFDRRLHETLGLSVLLLTVIRVAWRALFYVLVVLVCVCFLSRAPLAQRDPTSQRL